MGESSLSSGCPLSSKRKINLIWIHRGGKSCLEYEEGPEVCPARPLFPLDTTMCAGCGISRFRTACIASSVGQLMDGLRMNRKHNGQPHALQIH